MARARARARRFSRLPNFAGGNAKVRWSLSSSIASFTVLELPANHLKLSGLLKTKCWKDSYVAAYILKGQRSRASATWPKINKKPRFKGLFFISLRSNKHLLSKNNDFKTLKSWCSTVLLAARPPKPYAPGHLLHGPKSTKSLDLKVCFSSH